MSASASQQSRNASDISFAALTELKRFVQQANIRLTSRPSNPYTLHTFDGENRLESSLPRDTLGASTKQFVWNAVSYIESHEEELRIIPGAGPEVRSQRLDRLLIANELFERQSLHAGAGLLPERELWEEDICNILAFLSNASKRRYEHSSPEMTVAYFATPGRGLDYGFLGRTLLDEYKALLRLCRDAKTLIVTHREGVVTDLVALPGSANVKRDVPVPPRLEQVREFTRVDGTHGTPIVFNLNANGSVEILCRGEVIFRLLNNEWRFLDVRAVLNELAGEVTKCSDDGALIAYNLLTLAMDLADSGEGALLFLCDEPTTDVLRGLVAGKDGLVGMPPGWPREELSARNRFTQLVGTKGLRLNGQYDELPRLLRDVCSIDGATLFSYSGILLGFGCIVSLKSDDAGRLAEGARSNAAKQVSRKGCAVKVSSDGDATLFLNGENRGIFF